MSNAKQSDPETSAETKLDVEASDELSAEELDKVAGGVIAPIDLVAANPVLKGAQIPNVAGLPQIPGKGGLVL